jgi:membrane protease YdiL (CAAX protease family)
LTFGITWGIWIPLVMSGISSPWFRLGTFAPTLVALGMIIVREGNQGVKHLISKLTWWRVHAGWYIFAFLTPIPIILSAIWIDIGLGGPVPAFNDPAQLYLVIPAFLYVLFFSVAGEEIGWRGYALPRLLQRWSPLKASLILGLLWGAWHLPLFWMPGDFHTEIPLLAFMIQILAASVVYTWMHLNSRGGLLLAHIFHAASNTALGVLPVLPMETAGRLRPLWIAVGLWCLLVIVILMVTGTDLQNSTD